MSVKITNELVVHIAKLSMLKIDDNDVDVYQHYLSKILKHIEVIETVNVEGVCPLANLIEENLIFSAGCCIQRGDEIVPSLQVGDVLQNAPDQYLNQFKIEVVIGDQD